jgi:plasmid stabilization system protein ParE
MRRGEPAVSWSPEAEQDLVAVWIHVAREASPTVANEQLRSVDRACATLAEWPHSGRARDELFRGVRSIVWGIPRSRSSAFCTDGVTLMRSSLERESPDDGAGDVADEHRHKAHLAEGLPL